jgi:hypothetical protein
VPTLSLHRSRLERLLRDDLRDLAMFCAVYTGLDPDDETLCRYYGLLNLIPDAVKIAWGYGGEDSLEATAERMEREGVMLAKWEGLGD